MEKAFILARDENGVLTKKLGEFELSNSYEFLRNEVDGYIEHIYLELDELGITCWGNEEAKLIGLEPTLPLFIGNEMYDYACGNLVFTRCDDEGDTIGLNEQDFEIISNYINNTFNKYFNIIGEGAYTSE